MTLKQIANSCNGTLVGMELCQDENKEASVVVLDSRKMLPDGIFIAAKGEKVDGHSFIESVAQMGALGVVCEKLPQNPPLPCILVKDSFQALKDIAKFYRSGLQTKIVGVTGSVGKTSTKEFIASVLSQKLKVLKTEGNFNNEIGLPLTVLSIRAEHEVAVLEMGISDFGEMHRLSEIACPDICVITNIGQCHLENLGSRQGILKAKSEIFDFMNPEGKIFVNGDDDLLSTLHQVNGINPVRFGLLPQNDIYASEVRNQGLLGSHAVIHGSNQVFSVSIPLPGGHMVLNALAAAGVGFAMGLNYAEIAAGISGVESVDGRSHVIHLPNYTVIDDCYNANPVSVKAAIDLLSMTKGRRVAILGDMFELGEKEAELHAQVGEYITGKQIDVLICAGVLAENTYHAANMHEKLTAASKGTSCYYYSTRQEMQADLLNILRKGDTILIKASHGMHFEKVVSDLISCS